jgi:Uma2 family endonuclease
MSDHATAITPPPATWEDFLALGEDDPRELIDGRLVEVDVPTERHEFVVASLIAALSQWTRKHGGRELASGYKVKVSETRGVMPDVQLYRKGRRRGGVQGQGCGQSPQPRSAFSSQLSARARNPDRLTADG